MRLGVIAILVAGCTFDTGANPDQDGGGDPAFDAEVDPDATVAFDCGDWTPRPRHFDPCDIELPTAALALEDAGLWTYDTTNGALIDPEGNTSTPTGGLANQGAGPDFRYLSVASFSIDAGVTLRVIGTRPLVVAAWSSIEIDGAIAAGTDTAVGIEGPGSTDFACPGVGGNGQPHAGSGIGDGGAGGGGGGFRTAGAVGGDGGGSVPNGGIAGPALSGAPSVVRPGCRGGRGGAGQNGAGSNGAPGGFGGGALQLTARREVSIAGAIDAGGGGGRGAMGVIVVAGGGGGGGGSGGLIGIEAPVVELAATAILTANGGGGGEGGQPGDQGTFGGNGPSSTARAVGGSGHDEGGDGGDGGAEAGAATGGESVTSGGGGGGGTGFILIDSDDLTDSGATASPDLTPL